MLADVVKVADMGMVQRGDRAGFALESLPAVVGASQLTGQDLEGDEPIQPRIASLVDLAHPARAEQPEDFVGAEPDTGCEGHSGAR